MFLRMFLPMAKNDVSSLRSLNLTRCVPSCDLDQLSTKLIDFLLLAQGFAGFQFVINSAFRSKEYEISKGRKGTSSHCLGLAVDISTPDSYTRFKVVVSLALAGFPRIGIGRNFVHADIDTSKPFPIIFHYYDSQKT